MDNINMQLWNAVRRVPPEYLKKIESGRIKGKTDISPQWRMMALTEKFGQCGIGWKYTIDRLWTEPAFDGQVVAFALISLYTWNAQDPAKPEWSDPIPGIGGSMLLVLERNGMHTNDEAFKMAVTDALSVAAKALGVAADVYLGLWDGSKYNTRVQESTTATAMDQRQRQPVDRTTQTQQPHRGPREARGDTGPVEPPLVPYSNGNGQHAPHAAAQQGNNNDGPIQPTLINQGEYDYLRGLCKTYNISGKKWLEYIRDKYGISGAASLNKDQYNEVSNLIKVNSAAIDPGVNF